MQKSWHIPLPPPKNKKPLDTDISPNYSSGKNINSKENQRNLNEILSWQSHICSKVRNWRWKGCVCRGCWKFQGTMLDMRADDRVSAGKACCLSTAEQPGVRQDGSPFLTVQHPAFALWVGFISPFYTIFPYYLWVSLWCACVPPPMCGGHRNWFSPWALNVWLRPLGSQDKHLPTQPSCRACSCIGSPTFYPSSY